MDAIPRTASGPGRIRSLIDARLTGLWRHPDFVKLWAGQTISIFGDHISGLALPLTAVLALSATPTEMGIIRSAYFAPWLAVTLFVGVWVDRFPRRGILIGADIARALCLASIPAAALLSLLRIEQLYLVALLVGTLTVFFDVARHAYVPSLVQRTHLIEANGKLAVARSVADLTGPGVAGLLVQLLTAPVAIAVDSVSYVVSAIFLRSISAKEPPASPRDSRRSIWSEISEGLGVIFKNRLLWSIAGCSATADIFVHAAFTVSMLYLVRELDLTPVLIGAIFTGSSIGGVLGAALSSRISRRVGMGPSIIAAILLLGVPWFILPLVSGPPLVVVAILTAGNLVGGFAFPLYIVNTVSLRQAVTPDQLLGRMNASMRFLTWGTKPFGAFLGGVLGEIIGLRLTLAVGAAGFVLASLWVLLSPLRGLHEPPPLAEKAS